MDSVDWLVVGGSGLVGQAIVAAGDGRRIAATRFRSAAHAGSPPAAWVPLDVTDADAVAALAARLRPRVVFNAAVATAGDDASGVTTRGAAQVAAAARTVGAALIHLSTDMVFDGESGPYDEDAPPSPITPYGAAKAEAEALVRAAHPESIVVRLPLLYSLAPLDRANATWLEQSRRGIAYRLFADEIRCPAHVVDIAAVLVGLGSALGGDAAWPPPPPIVHLPGPRAMSRLELGRLVLAALALPAEWAVPGRSADAVPPRPRELVLLARHTPAAYLAPLRPPEVALEAAGVTPPAPPTPPTPPAGR